MCDASDWQTGATLSFGLTWETARPVAFDSMQLKGAEKNYPVHEKELLAIIQALKKWRADLMGMEFIIYTDHKTLQNFNSQRDLSTINCDGKNSCRNMTSQSCTLLGKIIASQMHYPGYLLTVSLMR
jgi:hypothetical protein